MFDQEAFLNSKVDAELETDFTPIPEDEYNAYIKELKADTTPNGSNKLDVTWVIDDEAVRELIGMDEPTCRQTIWLDIDDNGNLASGKNKNVKLGQLAEALGFNNGKPWAPAQLVGIPARVQIKHSMSNGKQYANVVAVTAR